MLLLLPFIDKLSLNRGCGLVIRNNSPCLNLLTNQKTEILANEIRLLWLTNRLPPIGLVAAWSLLNINDIERLRTHHDLDIMEKRERQAM